MTWPPAAGEAAAPAEKRPFSTSVIETQPIQAYGWGGRGTVFSTGALSSGGRGTGDLRVSGAGARLSGLGACTGVLSRRFKTIGARLRLLASASACRFASVVCQLLPATWPTASPTISW